MHLSNKKKFILGSIVALFIICLSGSIISCSSSSIKSEKDDSISESIQKSTSESTISSSSTSSSSNSLSTTSSVATSSSSVSTKTYNHHKEIATDTGYGILESYTWTSEKDNAEINFNHVWYTESCNEPKKENKYFYEIKKVYIDEETGSSVIECLRSPYTNDYLSESSHIAEENSEQIVFTIGSNATGSSPSLGDSVQLSCDKFIYAKTYVNTK